jgi:hypothetical protein
VEPDESVSHASPSSPEDFCSGLSSKIQSLNALGSSLKCPAKGDFSNKETTSRICLDKRQAHHYFADIVALRFPRAEKEVIKSLGILNWSRYNHIRQQRVLARDAPELTIADRAKSDFHDSGIGSSASVFAPHSVYAATVVSSMAEASHKRLPPLPQPGRLGAAFECEVCNRQVAIRRTKEWK